MKPKMTKVEINPSVALGDTVEIADTKSAPNFCKSLIMAFIDTGKPNSKVDFIMVKGSRINDLNHMYNNLQHFCRQSGIRASEGEPYAVVRKVFAKLPGGDSEQIVMLERKIKTKA